MEIFPNPVNRVRKRQNQLLTTQLTRPGYKTPVWLSGPAARSAAHQRGSSRHAHPHVHASVAAAALLTRAPLALQRYSKGYIF